MDSVSGIGVLDKTVLLLDAVGESPATLRQLTERTGISRATAHRLAQGMETVGLLRRDDAGAYRLGVRLIGLGRLAADAFPLATVARPILTELRDLTGESTQLYVVDGDDRLCVAAVDSVHELRTIVAVGARLPMARGSAGRVLSRDASSGDATTGGEPNWVSSVAERAPGVASVSAPVHRGGEVVAAVSVSGPIERLGDIPGDRWGATVASSAAQVSRALAGS